MTRHIWKGMVAAALAAAGLDAAAVHAAPPAADKADKDDGKPVEFTLMADGKERKCKVLSAKKMPDGSTAYEVKALDTGEVMTVLEPAPGKTTPPTPPPVAPVKTTPVPLKAPAAPAAPAGKAEAIPSAKNPPPAKGLPYGARPAPRVDAPRPLPPLKPEASSTSLKPREGFLSGLFDRGDRNAPAEGPRLLAPAAEASRPARVREEKEPSRPGFFQRLFGRSSKTDRPEATVAPPPAVRQAVPAPAPNQTAPPPLADPTPPAAPEPGPKLESRRPSPFGAVAKADVPGHAHVGSEAPAIVQASAKTVTPVVEPASRAAGHLAALRDALAPSQRQAAAEALLTCPDATGAEVRKALAAAVKDDPAASVRATCLRCLAKLGTRDELFRGALAAAAKDADPTVREEAARAR